MAQKLSMAQWEAMDPDEYVLLDVREESSFAYGHLPHAQQLVAEQAEQADFDKAKKIVTYCRLGKISEGVAQKLQERGYDAYYLEGGYFAWLKKHGNEQEKNEVQKRVESSLQKKFRKVLFSRFAKAVVDYQLVKPGDKICVCISGGKDSMLMAKLFQELKRHNKIPFELEFMVMDPGYNKANRDMIERNVEMLGIPATFYESDIFESVLNIPKSPCYFCARMRRGYLYATAKSLGCNKIALGHHYDDVIETILMGMLFGGQIQSMMPKLHSTNFEGMELIRPLYLIREKEVCAWRDYNELKFIQCACKFTEENYNDEHETKSARKYVKNLIAKLCQDDPAIDQNIFKSVENVQLATVVGYKDKDNVRHHFLDDYDG